MNQAKAMEWVAAGNSYSALAEANDAGVSFAKIADWIEQNWERL